MDPFILRSTEGDRALCWNVMLYYIMFKCISPLIILIVSSPTLFIWFQGRKKKRESFEDLKLSNIRTAPYLEDEIFRLRNIWIIFTSLMSSNLLLLTLSLIILTSANIEKDVREIGNQLITWKYPELLSLLCKTY